MTNRTDAAVRNMLGAILSPTYELAVQFGTSAPSRKPVTGPEILRLLPSLKARNLRGAHIYFQHTGPIHFTLLDDLSLSALADMRRSGYGPCAVVETSPGNFQAWLRHGNELSRELATIAARTLSARFGADPSAAGWSRLGRLAGFTNQKPKHKRSDGQFPFVLLREALGSTFLASDSFYKEISATLALELERRKPKLPNEPQNLSPQRGRRFSHLSVARFRELSQYAGRPAAADLAFCRAALSVGAVANDTAAVLRQSYLSSDQSVGRRERYIERTVQKALILTAQRAPGSYRVD